jgi:hypothetical protein
MDAIYKADTAAANAQRDLVTAYNDAMGRTNCAKSVAGNIGGQTLGPGLYKSTSSLAISSGDLTLSAHGHSGAVFIFQITSKFTTTSGRQVILAGGAVANHIYWVVGSSATLGSTSVVYGNILAHKSISLATGAKIHGRALANIGAVTLQGNTVAHLPFTSGLAQSGAHGIGAASCAQSKVPLGAAGNFRVLAGTTVTNTGATHVKGSIGVSPGSSITGFPPGTVSGKIHKNDTSALRGEAALVTAFNNAMGRATCATTLSGNIGGTTLRPGLYVSSTSLAVSSGNLTLNAHGHSKAFFIFQIGSSFTTTSGLGVILRGGANASHVFWIVGSSATIGSNSTVRGNFLANASISFATGAALHGRALAIHGAVTLAANRISR